MSYRKTDDQGPSMKVVTTNLVIRRNPSLDRLPDSRVFQGGKDKLPMNLKVRIR